MKERLYKTSVMREVLGRHGFHFSKSLGQNFLIDGSVLDQIAEGAELTEKDVVLEVGPGIGVLTQVLCERAGRVVAVEIDRGLLPVLEETLEDYDNVEVVHGDILKLNLPQLFEEKLSGAQVKVVANLPYYITTPIIMNFFEQKLPVERIVVMVQKEVADRMQAVPSTKAYGTLSIAVQYYAEAKIVTTVSSNSFFPSPNVDSAVIALVRREKPAVDVKDEEMFFRVVKAGFAQRRKTLPNTLSSTMGIEKDLLRQALAAAEIDPKRRGESLSLEEFGRLADAIGEVLA
ncbi:16S rRNA (adenine(1518)-N(6)/adenine(1519)-N(6)) -dimethyltransferase RsmA [Gottschalkiaceae bacterium SANA]|nr:16S rRNA (adenine(1518)-N(6)/adenine(1519)-N(6)) -dimethyltransferase RsmA [Gottschalkiaceae bacterium SANA]